MGSVTKSQKQNIKSPENLIVPYPEIPSVILTSVKILKKNE